MDYFLCILHVKWVLRVVLTIIYSIDVVTELLDGGFDINQKDIYGRTPLHWSALLLDLPLFLFLIEKGADYHIRSHV